MVQGLEVLGFGVWVTLLLPMSLQAGLQDFAPEVCRAPVDEVSSIIAVLIIPLSPPK